MRIKSKKLLWVFVLILALLGWTFRPYPTIDETKVHPSLRGLADSTECTWTSFGDGGSVAIIIRPTGGSEIDLCVSNSLNQSFFERGELYIGALYYTDPGSTKITGYDHSKYVVAKLLAKDIPKEPSVRSIIALLTMRASDWTSSFVHGSVIERNWRQSGSKLRFYSMIASWSPYPDDILISILFTSGEHTFTNCKQ